VELGDGALPDVGDRPRYIVFNLSEYLDRVGWDVGTARLKEVKAQARQRGSLVLAVGTPGLHTPREVTLLKLWADGVLELGFDRQGFGLYPYLKVTKMRGIPESSRFILFKETDAGLFMESTRRVF
jgi:KaiC/GvpD/RAD55 family RecA-like ATPase